MKYRWHCLVGILHSEGLHGDMLARLVLAGEERGDGDNGEQRQGKDDWKILEASKEDLGLVG